MTFKGHSRSSAMSSLIRSPGLSIRDRKSNMYTYFKTKIAEMTLEVDGRAYISIGHISLSIGFYGGQ